VQAAEVTLANLAPTSSFNSVSLTSPITVEIVGFGLSTVKPGVIDRVMASDQVRVDVLVTGAAVSSGDATMRIKGADGVVLSEFWALVMKRTDIIQGILSTHCNEYNLKTIKAHAFLTMSSSQPVMMSLDWYTVDTAPVLSRNRRIPVRTFASAESITPSLR